MIVIYFPGVGVCLLTLNSNAVFLNPLQEFCILYFLELSIDGDLNHLIERFRTVLKGSFEK